MKLLAVMLMMLMGCYAGVAYCTYHLYTVDTQLSSLTCSDGANGLIGWGYSALQPMFPYVAAWDQLKWNDSKCGSCIELKANEKTIHFTALDQCGAGVQGTDTHFDIAREAFYEIFGDAGIEKGSMTADWRVVDSQLCQANKKKSAPSATKVQAVAEPASPAENNSADVQETKSPM